MSKAHKLTMGGLAIALSAGIASAQSTPLTITSGFNQGLIADGPTAAASTTSTIDGSSVFYDRSYATAHGIVSGIFPAGSTVTGNGGNQYTFASALTDNALLLNDANASGSLSFTPTGLSTLNLLGLSANGGSGGGVSVNYILNFADATTATGSIFFNDWYDPTETLGTITGLQRVNQSTDFYDSAPGDLFSLFSVVIAIPVADQSLALDSITLTSEGASGSSVAVFAADGAPAPVPEPTPLFLAAAGVGLLAILRRRS